MSVEEQILLQQILDQLQGSPTTTLVDLIDKANRILGVVYGSQGVPLQQETNTNALKTVIYDTGGGDLDLVKQNDNFNAALHGIFILGLDYEGVPNKYKQIRCDNNGFLTTHLVDLAHNQINPATEDGNLASILAKLDVALSTRAALKQTSSRTPITIAAAGDNTIIAASAGNKHKLVKILLLCTTAVNVTLKSGANNLTGAMPFAANGGMAFDGDFYPLETNASEAFIINLSGAVQVSGWVQYFTEV